MIESDAAVSWLVRELRAHMRKRPKKHQLSDAALYAFRLYEDNVRALPSDHLACGAGCGSCCCAQVGVEWPEAFAILRHLQDTLSAADFLALMGRLSALAQQVGELDPGARWQVQAPCAFLDAETQSCTIYAVRPLACRGYTSTDFAACEISTKTKDHDHPIPADAERHVRALQVRQALALVAARHIDRDETLDHRELHGAVVAAHDWGDELAWARWARKR